jgi:antitoxin (DNA-binding transcriptional repressor) of toxin-antitoxin stability system
MVEVTRRGRIFARILPAAPRNERRTGKPDIMARLRADFGDLVVPDATVDEILREAGGSHAERLS